MQNLFQTGVILAILNLAAPVSHAEVMIDSGNAAAGADKSALCQGCHGGTGNSEDATFPRLAGQFASYIAKQINDFQHGKRANNETMAGMAATVASRQDAFDIGTYFQSQKMVDKPLAEVDKGLAAKGEIIFYNGIPQKNLYACVNCHGERGKGKGPVISDFPIIGGQHRDYVIKELTDLRAGTRANDPSGMMRNIAKNLSDDEIKELANYLSAQLP